MILIPLNRVSTFLPTESVVIYHTLGKTFLPVYFILQVNDRIDHFIFISLKLARNFHSDLNRDFFFEAYPDETLKSSKKF